MCKGDNKTKHNHIWLGALVMLLWFASIGFCQYFFYLETTIPVGINPTVLTYNSQNQKIYCANTGSNSVTVINQINNQVIATIRVGNGPSVLLYNPTSNKVYCANQSSNDVSIIDGLTNNVLNTVAVGSNPSALICDSIHNKVYCANAGSNNISVIDGANDNVIAIIAVGAYPTKLAYNPINNKIYCANTDINSVSIIDGNNYSVITTVNVGAFPYSLAYNPITNKIYCASWANGRIHIIDGATNQFIDSLIYFNSGPQSLVYVNYNKIWYVNFTGDNIKTIDGSTNAISDSIQLSNGTRPFALSTGIGFVYTTSITKNKVMVLSCMSYLFDSLSVDCPFAVYPTWIPSGTRVYVTSLTTGAVSVFRCNFPGVEQIEKKQLQIEEVKVYPNPARAFFTVRLPQDVYPYRANRAEIKMFDVAGKMVKKQEFKSSRVSELRVSTQGLNQGVYFIRVDNLPKLKKIEVVR